jgi:hypothetical protein
VTFARPDYTALRAERREANLRALCQPSRTLHTASYTGTASGESIDKPQQHRSAALLEMARDRPCLLMVPGLCNHRTDTTVAAHSNLGIHGKAGARKADDQYSAWACACCHMWLDTSKALASQKEAAFMAAHARQVLAWRLVAMDPKEPERFRKAALWALGLLNATL